MPQLVIPRLQFATGSHAYLVEFTHKPLLLSADDESVHFVVGILYILADGLFVLLNGFLGVESGLGRVKGLTFAPCWLDLGRVGMASDVEVETEGLRLLHLVFIGFQPVVSGFLCIGNGLALTL